MKRSDESPVHRRAHECQERGRGRKGLWQFFGDLPAVLSAYHGLPAHQTTNVRFYASALLSLYIVLPVQILIHRLGQNELEPYCETVFAAVLFADISGFTRLSARLSEEELKFHIKYVVWPFFLTIRYVCV